MNSTVIGGRSSLNRSPGTSSRPDGRHPGIQEEPPPFSFGALAALGALVPLAALVSFGALVGMLVLRVAGSAVSADHAIGHQSLHRFPVTRKTWPQQTCGKGA